MSKGFTRQRFAADLESCGVRLPLSISEQCQATMVDADGRDVATIDMNRTRPDQEAIKIALWVALSVNTCAGHPPPVISLSADATEQKGQADE